MTTSHYLTYSDGSESGGQPEYGIAYENGRDGTWVWDQSLGTADPDTALRMVADLGYVAVKVPGGWYGDSRDDSYRLEPAGRLPDGSPWIARHSSVIDHATPKLTELRAQLDAIATNHERNET
jgi:hypothetical protein